MQNYASLNVSIEIVGLRVTLDAGGIWQNTDLSSTAWQRWGYHQATHQCSEKLDLVCDLVMGRFFWLFV